MADRYWRYADARQPPLPPPPALPAVKRSRPDYDVLGGHELPGFYPRGEESGGQRLGRDDMSLGASYDRYLPGVLFHVRMQQMSSHGAGEPPRHLSPRLPDHPIDDPRMMGFRGIDPDIFRPFVGFREVRLVNKGSKRPGGEPLVLCFVDFTTPAHAAVASEALQGE
ncbi:RNA recognition motif domain-containing protein [Cinnamomum micranthum f. kanehirae]|uniref:RNA recognition motif domain-containing protein n=1 Tax=Cinnamomum micranthum f. kanehirae TaxID=337451 RepID=A0A443P769_9MAGN|nr:RNA recognition motif domain-containing protein [Cinnamomum micranthum f. kanehirae]